MKMDNIKMLRADRQTKFQATKIFKIDSVREFLLYNRGNLHNC